MSIFNQKSKFKIKTEVRKVKTEIAPTPQRKPSTNGTSASRLSLSAPSSAHGTPRASPRPSSHLSRRLPSTSSPETKSSSSTNRKRRAPASRSPATASPAPVLSDSEPGSDDDDDWRERLDPSKRRKRAHTEDPDRRLRHSRLWTGQGEDEKPAIVHAVDVAALGDKCQPVMKLGRDEVGVRLRYPGAKYLER
jgi:H3 lysine-79-specific histone-lysine N-methyltransferase